MSKPADLERPHYRGNSGLNRYFGVVKHRAAIDCAARIAHDIQACVADDCVRTAASAHEVVDRECMWSKTEQLAAVAAPAFRVCVPVLLTCAHGHKSAPCISTSSNLLTRVMSLFAAGSCHESRWSMHVHAHPIEGRRHHCTSIRTSSRKPPTPDKVCSSPSRGCIDVSIVLASTAAYMATGLLQRWRGCS